MLKLLVVLCALTLLCACGASTPTAQNDDFGQYLPSEDLISASSEKTAPSTEMPSNDVVAQLSDALDTATQFLIQRYFLNLDGSGVEQTITRSFAADQTLLYLTQTRRFSSDSAQEVLHSTDYYYVHEGHSLACYARNDGGEPQTAYFSQAQYDEIYQSQRASAGKQAIFPSYLEDFSEADEANGSLFYSFSLPTQQVLNDTSDISNFIRLILNQTNMDASVLTGTSIACYVWADPDTMRPMSIHMDFSELKPVLLGGDASEFAYIDITLQYDVIATTELPEDFLVDASTEN